MQQQVSSSSSSSSSSSRASGRGGGASGRRDMSLFPSIAMLTSKCDLYDEVSEIIPGLFLSSISPVYEPKTMRDHSIKAVLSVLSDEPDFEHLDNVTYHYIEVDDHENSDLLSRFTHTNQLIGGWRAADRNVLVHCYMGVSRSATIVIAFLMAHLKIGFRAALDLVRSKRSVISPNHGFREQLAYFEHLNFRLCSTDVWYRRYLFARVVFAVSNVLKNMTIAKSLLQGFRPNADSLGYIQKLTSGEHGAHDHIGQPCQVMYKCKDCRRVLFTDREVLHADVLNLFVHILPWMETERNYFLPFGKIYCPYCGRKLGRYKWVPPYLNIIHFKFGSSAPNENPHELKVPMVFTVTASSVDASQVNQQRRQ